MNTNAWRPWLPAAGSVLFLTKLPYMVQAMRQSRPDHWDWVFWVGFAALTAVLWPRLRRWAGGISAWFLTGAGVGVLLYGFGIWQPVHALSILGGVIFAWSMTGVAFGGKVACAMLPVFGILGLSCTGSTYWIGYFSGCDGLTVKVFAGLLLALWALATAWSRKLLPVRWLLFAGGLGLLLFLYFFHGYRYEIYPAFHPAVDAFRFGAFIGREVPVSASDRHFFGDSRIRRAFFADDPYVVAVLKVCDFEDVHKIHPAGYCLRAAGRSIQADRLYTTHAGGHGLQVNEILVDNGDGTFMLLWAWYTSDKNSSGSFLFFRRNYSRRGDWSTYQVAATGLGSGSGAEIAAARTVLETFLTEWAAVASSGER